MACRINGMAQSTLGIADRGFAYGDGVFRTLAWQDGRVRLWREQYARLQADCQALRLAVPQEAWLRHEIAAAAAGLGRAVVKVTVTRGEGGRGYAIAPDLVPTVLVCANEWGGYPASLARDGVCVRWCDFSLAVQPRLAGIKHLNRLENVLARSEWQDPSIQEGLLCDTDGWVVEGTMSNLFVLRAGVVLTPRLDRCGVSGAMRARLLALLPTLGVPWREARLSRQDVVTADAAWLCNSLIGVWPIAVLGTRHWQDFTLAQALQVALAAD